MACLLGRPKELEADPRIELNPWLLRSVDVDVLESLIVQRVALRLVTGHLLPPCMVKRGKLSEKNHPNK
jgi:hypothetical protein